MLEKVYEFYTGAEKSIERVIMDENVHLMRMVLPKGDALPEHCTNANVYMIVARGTLSISLEDGERNEYAAGHVLNIPEHIKMNVKNFYDETLELFVVKAPAPKK
ncbi:MAG TPA: cupin domain-containing protein [Oscillospiraceae bacterium]|nr:cupin domain-containing protein [Oscillospiraceae bacterium]HPS35760.1 cupin domain-containing protein [Oscillospiraceae bacterium]